jgi:Tfp pilus assembly protein PilN
MEGVDFLPERIRARRAQRRRLIRQGYLLAACAAALLALGFHRQARVGRAQAELALLSERRDEVQRRLSVLSGLQRQHAELMLKKRIDDALGSRAGALDVLAELEKVMPAGVVLRELKLEAVTVRVPVSLPVSLPVHAAASLRPQPAHGRAAQKDREVKRVELEMVGLASDDGAVANFIGQLSDSPVFEDVRMGYTRNTTFQDRAARGFKLICYVVR